MQKIMIVLLGILRTASISASPSVTKVRCPTAEERRATKQRAEMEWADEHAVGRLYGETLPPPRHFVPFPEANLPAAPTRECAGLVWLAAFSAELDVRLVTFLLRCAWTF